MDQINSRKQHVLRLLLVVLHGLGAAVFFLPFVEEVSPARLGVNWDSSQYAVLVLVISFGLPLVITCIQARSCQRQPWGRITWVAMVLLAIVVIVSSGTLSISIVIEILRALSGRYAIALNGALVASAAILFAGGGGAMLLTWMTRTRSLRMLWLLLWPRCAFVGNIGAALLLFFGLSTSGTWSAGGWLSLLLVVLYLAEIIYFSYLARKHHRLPALWLPAQQPQPPRVGDEQPCEKCGYDLSGSLAAGRKVCPECGRIAATHEVDP